MIPPTLYKYLFQESDSNTKQNNWQSSPESETSSSDDFGTASPDTEPSTPLWDEYLRAIDSSLDWNPTTIISTGHERIRTRAGSTISQPQSVGAVRSETLQSSYVQTDCSYIAYVPNAPGSPDHVSTEDNVQDLGSSEFLSTDRKLRRKQQNRASQRRFRASKEAKIKEFQERIRVLEAHLEHQIERNNVLERNWTRVKADLERLTVSLVT